MKDLAKVTSIQELEEEDYYSSGDEEKNVCVVNYVEKDEK